MPCFNALALRAGQCSFQSSWHDEGPRVCDPPQQFLQSLNNIIARAQLYANVRDFWIDLAVEPPLQMILDQ